MGAALGGCGSWGSDRINQSHYLKWQILADTVGLSYETVNASGTCCKGLLGSRSMSTVTDIMEELNNKIWKSPKLCIYSTEVA